MNWEALLATLSADTARYFDLPHAKVEVLGIEKRPFSDVARVEVSQDGQTRRAYIKVTRPRGATEQDRESMARRVRQEFDESSRVHGLMNGQGGLGVVRPLACIPEDLVLITEEASGETLAARLERDAAGWPSQGSLEGLCAVLEQVSRWLRAFQQVDPVPGRLDLDEMREYLDVRLVRLTGHPEAGFSDRDRQALLEYFDVVRRGVDASNRGLVRIHADLAPGNVLVERETVTVLDFAMANVGSVYHDISRLFTQLEFLKVKPTFRPRVVRRLQEALLAGFEPGLSPARPLFRLFVLQHTVTHFATVAASRRRGAGWLFDLYLRRRHRKWLRNRVAPR